MAEEKKQTIFSGIQPTGVFTLGNYLGAIRNWRALQDEYFCIYSVVDMHAITVRQDAAALRAGILDAYALLLACGIDPEKSLLFTQSSVPAHAELAWMLSCFTAFGELSRMTQFKDKSVRHADNINAGLFTYPVLMAADILLYQANLVPVGADQKQHLEITRDIAARFNAAAGETFVLPEPYIPKIAARIMSLLEPEKKMSKSDPNPGAFISILDSEDVIIKKFRRAVTDSGSEVRFAEGKDGINNLITVYSSVTGKSFSEIENEFSGKGYGDFKTAVGEVVAHELRPVREGFSRFRKDKAYLEDCMKNGAAGAARIAGRTVSKVKRKVGFLDLR